VQVISTTIHHFYRDEAVAHHREIAPLQRATEQAEVGDTGLFLVSDLGRGITGEVIYVDGGYNILGAIASMG
jgi:enoyl-[acyl-carrier protein] reductase I